MTDTINISTNFSLIKFVSKASSLRKINLTEIFDAVLNGEALEVDESHLKDIFQKELQINVSNLDCCYIKALIESVIYFITTWPKWHSYSEYEDSGLRYGHWFKDFRMYLTCNMNSVLNYLYMPTGAKGTDQSTQTEEATVAPFNLFVEGPFHFVDNIVFSENNGDIVIKQHEAKQWQSLSLTEFLNWPNVSVEVKFPDFSFTRTNSHKYDRFIGLNVDVTSSSEINRIIQVRKLLPDLASQPYTYNFLYCYFFQLCRVLHEVPSISKDRIVELELILSQFLKDVNEIDICNKTMSTNTCVGFRIGNSRYIKVNNSDDLTAKRIDYYEIINPKVDLNLIYFNAKEDCSTLTDQNPVGFESLNQLLHKCKNDKLHKDVVEMRNLVKEKCITYICTICKAHFDGYRAYDYVMTHFREFHNYEDAVKCFKCGKSFKCKRLSGSRWAHLCL
ncbi:hypothetical protein RN001_014269 [Aquatica leii]|uniref:C2H2-type domain-containing protein n=1 Tax=Aquatica leii TaxID=1421715 RepID=A0AAN7PRL6_9COLE|nr:hypothetical protein RN001_014269 [Aquatica leii]